MKAIVIKYVSDVTFNWNYTGGRKCLLSFSHSKRHSESQEIGSWMHYLKMDSKDGPFAKQRHLLIHTKWNNLLF